MIDIIDLLNTLLTTLSNIYTTIISAWQYVGETHGKWFVASCIFFAFLFIIECTITSKEHKKHNDHSEGE